MRSLVAALIAALVLCAGCSQTSKQEQIAPDRFLFDGSLLGDPVRDQALGVSFAPPKEWSRISEEMLRAAAQDSLLRATHYVYGFNEPTTGSVFTVIQLDKFDAADSSSTIGGYRTEIVAADSLAAMAISVFSSSRFRVHELIIRSSGFVVTRLVFSGAGLPRAVRLDFSFPAEHYDRLLPLLHSVAASVRPLQ